MGNIYESKRYKLMVIVPIAMLLLSLLFIGKIPLDSTLLGGINVQLQTNSSISAAALTATVNAKIPNAQASVSTSPGGVSVQIAANSSLSDAQTVLLNIYGTYGNYSSDSVKVATYQSILKNGPNATVQGALAGALTNQSSALSTMNTQISQMLKSLTPLLNGKGYPYNASDAQSIVTAAGNAYANASANYQVYIISTLKGIVPFTSYSYQEVTPTLGAFFLQQMETVIIASFIIVALAVLFLFRSPIPALSVVFGAGNDIIVALGLMGLFGIPLGVASIGGLLMLIGYSIDTDMLSAIRVLKRNEGTPSDRAWSTMKTGITMTTAAIITFSILLIVSYLTFIQVYFEISSVVLFGLVADIFTTWFGNTVMVLWYKQRKDARGS